MSAGLLAARLVLAAVFCASGIPKFGDRTGTRATAAAFGVPARLTSFVALALPVAELLVAAALIPASAAALAGWAALALLAVFSGAVLVSLARGAATLLGTEPVTQTIVEMAGGYLFATAVSAGSTLVVHTERDCDLGMIAYEMTMLATSVGHALTPAGRGAPARS